MVNFKNHYSIQDPIRYCIFRTNHTYEQGNTDVPYSCSPYTADYGTKGSHIHSSFTQ